MLTLSLPSGADYAHTLALPHLKFYRNYALGIVVEIHENERLYTFVIFWMN